ncbi:MAG: PAS domain S-box protein [Acidobacteria bacterium]|nr:PAS domain S-box protein [Acidobacteriota bacterium]
MARPVKVLVIEDSEDDARLLIQELERAGFAPEWLRIQTADELERALDEGGWELILSDYRMPGFTGAEALSMVRSRGLDAPFIVISGTAGEETAVQMMRDGADDYFLKGMLRLLPGAVARELREAEARRARRDAEHQLRLVTRALEASANALVLTDRDGTIQWVNPAFTYLTGYEAEEAIGENPRILKSEKQPESFYAELWNTILDGRVWHGELINKRKDKTFYTEEMTITPVTGESGEVTHFIAVKQDVTERKQMLERLQESEERFRSLYENATIGIYRTTPAGQILMANPALVEMLGYDSFEELARKNLEDRTHYIDRPRAEFKRIIEEKGEIRGLESMWRRRDGAAIYVRESARAVRDSRGQTLYYEGTVEDITERRRTEEALRDSEARYRDLVDHSHELMSTMTLDGTILSVNRAVEDSLGMSADTIVGRNVRDLLAPRYRDFFDAYRETMLERGEASGIMRVVASSGEERLWEYRNTVRSENVPEPIVRGLSRDITEEWQARKKLEESEARYRDLVEKAGVAITVNDEAGRVTYFNRRFAALFGYSQDEIRAMTITDFVHQHDRERVAAIHRSHIGGGDAPWSFRYRGVNRDGQTLHLVVDVTPLIRGGTVVGTRWYIRDVTEEETLQEQLLQAQKMESVGRLAGGVAHDFNNILQAILAHADVAMAGLGGGASPEDHLREIRTAAERAANLTRQLLSFSRREEIHPKPLDLNDLTADMLKMLRRVIGEDIEILFEPGHGDLIVDADPGQLEQVLLNLAINARDAMPGGGRLTIATGLKPAAGDAASPRVWLQVRDTGCGMDEATRKRIFEPFFTTKERGRGTGLGLATVYGIVQRHGATIDVESEDGAGSTFTIWLPAAAGAVSVEPSGDHAPVTGGAETLLVAEDDPAVRDVVVGVLQEAGYSVLVACDGVEAVDLFTGHAREVDLVVLDAMMPRMDGVEALARMREIRPGLPALFSSGYSGQALGRSYPLPSNVAVLQKPYSTATLLSTIREALDSTP